MAVRGVFLAVAIAAVALLARVGAGYPGPEQDDSPARPPSLVELELPVPIQLPPGAREALPAPPPPEGEPPAWLAGAAEDDTLALSARAVLGDNGLYRVRVTVTNKARRGVDLLYDCGSLLWWQGVRSSWDPSRTCVAVYSRLLEAGESVELQGSLAPDRVQSWDALAVAVRYLPSAGGGAGSARVVAVPLRAAP